MKLTKAIEILTERHRIRDPLKNLDYEDALKLGIEALKEVKRLRNRRTINFDNRLPGEEI